MITPASTPVPARRRFLGRLLALAAGMALPWRSARVEAAPQANPPHLGDIMLFAGINPPEGWAFCEGQLLPINQFQQLFGLIGSTYGGDGQVSFALPDLRGRVAIHQGQGSGLSPRTRGERSGLQVHVLALAEIPAHTHVARGSSVAATAVVASASMVPARNPAAIPQWGTSVDTALAATAMTATGGSQVHENMQPYLTLNYAIALQGVVPTP